jgi:hypothetical protein
MGEGGQEVDRVGEKFGQLVCWGVAPIYNRSDRLSCL